MRNNGPDYLTLLDVPADWTPDAARILQLVETRRQKSVRRRRILWMMGAALSIPLIMMLATSSSRAVAQRLFERLFATRVDYLPFSAEHLTNRLPASIRGMFTNAVPPREEPVNSLSEAIERAGFTPRLPQTLPAGTLTTPKYSVITETTRNVVIHTAELKTLLTQAHIDDVVVPDSWNGTVLELHHSAGIKADYGNFYVAQRLPQTIDAPPGFPVDEFVEVLFRIIGINAPDARRLREKFAMNAGDFLKLDEHGHRYAAREVQLAGGPGLLVQDFQSQIPFDLFWSTRDRFYLIYRGGISEAEMLDVANSIRTN
jgi:hypothetical protein